MTDNSGMCCFTHANRIYGPAAADARMRCRCGVDGGGQCDRQADAEDLLCAVCRVGVEPPLSINSASPGWFRVAGVSADGEVTWARVVPAEPPFPGGLGEIPDLFPPDR